jgi:cellobiose-specific phosphotransferase system component IIB
MALADFFARFYDKVFIGLYARNGVLQVGVVIRTSRGETEVQQRTFAGGLDEEALDFLQEQVEVSPYNHIALLTDSGKCGALPTCSLSKAKEMAPIVARSKTVCVDEEWMNYCDEEVLYRLQEQYAPVSLDAIYVPFALMHAHFETVMTGAHALYLLITPEAMSLAVVKERHLRFAEQFCCDTGASVALMVEKITAALEAYYGKPCCRGEFIEAVQMIDGSGMGILLAEALEEALLLEVQTQEIDVALLCAQTCMKENGYGL